MKKTEEIKKMRAMKSQEILAELKEKKVELTLQSLKVKADKENKVSEVNKSKKNVARLLTILNENLKAQNGK